MIEEIAKTLREELRRLSAAGEEFIFIEDDSFAKLKSASAKVLKKEAAPAISHGNLEKITIEEKQPIFDEEIEELDAAKLSEIEFVHQIDMSKIKTDESDQKEKKLKIKRTEQPAAAATLPQPKPFSLPEGDKAVRWKALQEIVLSDPVCNAHIKPQKKVVFGVGNLDAKIFFCGEAPGADEEIQGEPFVGRAGQLLTKIIGAMGLSRKEVYIGNIMNWRPEVERGNRPPTQEEMEYCLPYLKAQIDIVKPDIVVALGMTAVNGLLGYDQTRRMGKIRGKWTKFGDCDLMITYHPSFLLQYASAAMKRLVWEDMMAVMERAGIPISEKQRGYYANAKQ